MQLNLPLGLNPDCKTYPLSQQEQKDLQEFIDENLRTGCIAHQNLLWHHLSSCQEKDGKLRPTQDYPKA